MCHFAKLVGSVLLASFLGGCVASRPTVVGRVPKPSRPVELARSSQYVRVATYSPLDVKRAEAALDSAGIAHATVNGARSIEVLVKGDDGARARAILQEDATRHGYSALTESSSSTDVPQKTAVVAVVSVDPKYTGYVLDCLRANGFSSPEVRNVGPKTSFFIPATGVDRAQAAIGKDANIRGYEYEMPSQVESTPAIEPERQVPVVEAPSLKARSLDGSGKLVTVVAVASKDAKSVVDCLQAVGIKVRGTWESRGVTGVVVADGESLNLARKAIHDDSKKSGYALLTTEAREPAAKLASSWTNPRKTKEDLSGEADLVVLVREKDGATVAGCLEAADISSGSSIFSGTCAVYVSKLDAAKALALIQEDAWKKGYAYSTERVKD